VAVEPTDITTIKKPRNESAGGSYVQSGHYLSQEMNKGRYCCYKCEEILQLNAMQLCRKEKILEVRTKSNNKHQHLQNTVRNRDTILSKLAHDIFVQIKFHVFIF
jgi:hypothetical protein